MDGDHIRLLKPCGHYFHYDCVTCWLLSSTQCPTCHIQVQTDPEVQCSYQYLLKLLQRQESRDVIEVEPSVLEDTKTAETIENGISTITEGRQPMTTVNVETPQDEVNAESELNGGQTVNTHSESIELKSVDISIDEADKPDPGCLQAARRSVDSGSSMEVNVSVSRLVIQQSVDSLGLESPEGLDNVAVSRLVVQKSMESYTCHSVASAEGHLDDIMHM